VIVSPEGTGERTVPASEVESIARSFVEGEAKIARRVLNAISVSEQAVLNVGDSVGDIVHHAREHVDASARLAVRFGRDSEIGQAIAQQSDDMGAFVDRVTVRLREQRERAGELHDQLGRIMSAGERIRTIARETKIVTVNAQIEAARLGSVGKPFVVIAEQLAALADDIGVANRLVGQLARTMKDVMPRLAENTDVLLTDSERFRERFTASLRELEQTQSELHNDVFAAVQEGEKRSERILRGSQNALSQLQFQDPMAQSLREVSRITKRTRALFEAALGTTFDHHEVAEDGQTLRVGDLMTRLAGAQEIALKAEATGTDDGGESTDDTPDSGDVLLF